jgi:hypothetical protein
MQFFTGQKRRLMLCDVALKLNSQNEKRIRLDFSMPLTGHSVVGMPTPVMKAFEAVAQLDNGIIDTDLALKADAQTIEFFPHDKRDAPRLLQLNNAELQSFTVSRPNTDQAKKRDEVTLYFTTTVPSSRKIWDWAYEHVGAEMFSVFTATQPQLEIATTPAATQDSLLKQHPDAKRDVDALPVRSRANGKNKVQEIPESTKAKGTVGAAS